MVIEENIKTVAFGELDDGDVFHCGSIYYLKVPTCTSEAGYDYNSFDLVNNDYCYFSDEKDVIFVRAKLVIE
jgi:hypothetical protein